MSDTLQEDLRKVFAKARVPSSPALAARILELAEDPDSTIDQFADLIQMDPALAARLLSMTNSAACSQREEVTTIQRAVSLLGINRVRTLSLGFQLVGHLGRLGGCPFDMQQFWRHSLLRACLGREFAEATLPSCADEAFLMGLLQDSGTLLLVQILGKSYADLCQTKHISPSAFFATEIRLHPYNHAETTAALAREWKLPEIFVTNMELHHTEPPLSPAPTDADKLRSLIYLIGSVPLTTTEEVDIAEPVLSQFANEHLGMDAAAVQNAIAAAGEAYAEMASILQGVVPDDLDVTDLLSQANAYLTTTVESERRHSVQQQEQLRSALGQYRERAARDPLTGILNRGALNDTLGNAVKLAKQTDQTVTVLFIDLDNFKSLNDTFGHHAGDEVLKGVSETLKACVANAGVAGRYGGEEFLLAVAGLTEPEARELAEAVVVGVRQTKFPGLGFHQPITCSLGAAWARPGPDMTTESIIRVADELMYEAKNSGKDCYRFRNLGDPGAADMSKPTDSEGASVGPMKPGDRVVTPEEYQRIAVKLESTTPQEILNLRKTNRKKLFASCTVTAFLGATLEFESEIGFVRNISTGGAGILVARSMLQGQPVEIAIPIEDKPTLYVAGLVAFCRHAEGAVHEVGVQIFTHSKTPILSADPISAIRNLDWVAQALQSTERSGEAVSRSNAVKCK